MNIHAWNQASIQQAMSELDRIQGALESLYGDEKRSYEGMRADFNMDGTSEEMDVNHDLLMRAKDEAIECIQMTRETFRKQSDTADTTMTQVRSIVNSLRA